MKNIIKKVAMKYGIFKRKVKFKNYDIWFYVFLYVGKKKIQKAIMIRMLLDLLLDIGQFMGVDQI